MLTVAEVARELRISREAVYKAVREGRMESVQILGKIGISREALISYQPLDIRIQAGRKRAATTKRAKTK
jgi:excisionase family DNA binding protein